MVSLLSLLGDLCFLWLVDGFVGWEPRLGGGRWCWCYGFPPLLWCALSPLLQFEWLGFGLVGANDGAKFFLPVVE